jgi:hypothetical protein
VTYSGLKIVGALTLTYVFNKRQGHLIDSQLFVFLKVFVFNNQAKSLSCGKEL